MAKAKKKEPRRKASVERKHARTQKDSLKPKAKVKRKGNTRVITRPGTRATPGVRENQRTPFLDSEDIWDIGEEKASWDQEIGSSQREYEERLAALPQSLDDIRRQARDVRESQSSNAIERGIFKSSINEMALTDINVAEAVSTEAAKSLVANAQAELERVRNDVETVRKPRLFVRAGQRARENAEQWNAEQEWQREPTAATPATTVTDYDARTPGIQTRQQANRNAAKRARQQPHKPGAGRGTQRPQPNRPGGPRKATVKRVKPGAQRDLLGPRKPGQRR